MEFEQLPEQVVLRGQPVDERLLADQQGTEVCGLGGLWLGCG
jgi:hypothetical protein